VAYVDRGGPAAAAGLPRDVVVTAVDDVPVSAPADIRAYLEEAPPPVLVEVQRADGTKAFYEIQ
jgi:S1-C subfamily serine protease